ncbi:MAG TPA: nucleotidyltransferase domain-containing protein [Acidimicrobiales bacterium]|nr:nucleotidyltransferase domain-containing protein [Acidimicrobiales bacterium]
MSGNPYLDSPRWVLAEEITAALRRRWPAEIHAVGVHGSLAHGDDADGSDVSLVVVTFRSGAGPRPGARRIDGTLVDLGVIGAEEYLEYARTLSTSWPLAADQYLTTKPLYDPEGWYPRLRDTHLGRLAEAGGAEFATLARDAWCHAEATYAKALRLAEWHDTAGALFTFGEARLATALIDGLLTRTYFRDSADAVRRTGLGDADLTELGRRLRGQADELAKRGRPVDASIPDLLSAS